MFTPDLYTDLMWLDRISMKLDHYKKVSGNQNVYNCRCPVCGDSKKSQTVTRFYFYQSKSQCLNVDCKNCGYGKTFYNFMKEVFPQEFIEYKKDQISTIFSGRKYESKSSSHVVKPEPIKLTTDVGYLKYLTPIASLHSSHPAVQYLRSRSLSDEAIKRLFYCDRFKEFCAAISYKELSDKFPDDPRIIIPFYSVDGHLEMIQGRSLSKSGLRYITIKCSPDVDKVFGKNLIDPEMTTYVCEGPFDSLFVNNCVATCDSSLTRVKADVYIWDNEPRNPDIHKLMRTAIESGKQVVIWPVSPDHKIDINDMINAGLTQGDVMSIIEDSTYKGNIALMKFHKWKRI